MESLQYKLIKFKDIEDEKEEDMEKLNKLYEAGVINKEGDYINNNIR